MAVRTLLREWWVILLQGIFLIALSIIIFKNPGPVLTTVAIWLAIVVIVTGITGMIAWFLTPKDNREVLSLVGSIAILIVGILMMTKTIVTIKAITIVFGIIVFAIGLVLTGASWKVKKVWNTWWILTLIGLVLIFMGVKSVVDIVSGIQNISNLIAIAMLIGGIGLIVLAFLKKKFVPLIRNRMNEINIAR